MIVVITANTIAKVRWLVATRPVAADPKTSQKIPATHRRAYGVSYTIPTSTAGSSPTVAEKRTFGRFQSVQLMGRKLLPLKGA